MKISDITDELVGAKLDCDCTMCTTTIKPSGFLPPFVVVRQWDGHSVRFKDKSLRRSMTFSSKLHDLQIIDEETLSYDIDI